MDKTKTQQPPDAKKGPNPKLHAKNGTTANKTSPARPRRKRSRIPRFSPAEVVVQKEGRPLTDFRTKNADEINNKDIDELIKNGQLTYDNLYAITKIGTPDVIIHAIRSGLESDTSEYIHPSFRHLRKIYNLAVKEVPSIAKNDKYFKKDINYLEGLEKERKLHKNRQQRVEAEKHTPTGQSPETPSRKKQTGSPPTNARNSRLDTIPEDEPVTNFIPVLVENEDSMSMWRSSEDESGYFTIPDLCAEATVANKNLLGQLIPLFKNWSDLLEKNNKSIEEGLHQNFDGVDRQDLNYKVYFED